MRIFQRACRSSAAPCARAAAAPTTLLWRSYSCTRPTQLSKYPQLVKLEQTTNIPKAYGAIGAFSLFTIVRVWRVR